MLVKPQLLLLAASFAGIAAAQGPAKIGLINIQAAIANTEDGKKAIQTLEAKFAPKRKEIERRQQEIQQKQAQLQKGGAVLAEEHKRKLMTEIDSMTKVFNRDVEDASQDLEQEQQRVLQDIGQKMQAVIDKYARENGYTLILDVSSPQSPVLYAASETEVTREIVDAYNKSVGAAPAPAGAAAAPATPTPTAPASLPVAPKKK